MRTREDILHDLLDEVLKDPAELDPGTRVALALNVGAPLDDERGRALQALGAKIHGGAYRVTDEDIAAVRALGVSEDEVFEAIVSSSVGAALTRYDVAMKAWREA